VDLASLREAAASTAVRVRACAPLRPANYVQIPHQWNRRTKCSWTDGLQGNVGAFRQRGTRHTGSAGLASATKHTEPVHCKGSRHQTFDVMPLRNSFNLGHAKLHRCQGNLKACNSHHLALHLARVEFTRDLHPNSPPRKSVAMTTQSAVRSGGHDRLTETHSEEGRAVACAHGQH
jgi:hypothetical protein